MVIIICGSPRGANSKTAQLACDILDGTGLEYELLTPAQWHIEPCLGCQKCFLLGHCVQETPDLAPGDSCGDDMSDIINKMIAAEGIIFASPVYSGSVTGQMKIFIDRMSTYLHTMILLGKPAMTVVTSSRSHAESTCAYLREILEFAGASVIGDVISTGKGINVSVDEASEIFRKAVLTEDPLPLSKRTELWRFSQQRKYRRLSMVALLRPEKFGEALVWNRLHPDLTGDPGKLEDLLIRLTQ